jgi:hypothetical protein
MRSKAASTPIDLHELEFSFLNRNLVVPGGSELIF